MTDIRYQTTAPPPAPVPIVSKDHPIAPIRHPAGHHYLVQDFPATRFTPAHTVERRITREEFDRLKREEHLPQVETALPPRVELRQKIIKIKEIIGHRYKYKAPSTKPTAPSE
jgi:hypothetical protein